MLARGQPLAAFDTALINAGVANHNLICLSSVIPPAGVIQRAPYVAAPDAYGDRLYVVMARQIEEERGMAAWAGLGWTQDAASGRGLFVEIHGSQQEKVAQDIQATLTTMIANRSLTYGAIEMEIAGIECRRHPVCAIVVAVYQSDCWRMETNLEDKSISDLVGCAMPAETPRSIALILALTLISGMGDAIGFVDPAWVGQEGQNANTKSEANCKTIADRRDRPLAKGADASLSSPAARCRLPQHHRPLWHNCLSQQAGQQWIN